MILRSVIKHVRNQEWTAVFLDFLIVVVGVFVGLQVQEWNQGRKDRVDEAIFLSDLHDDIMRASKQSARTEAIRFEQAKNLKTAVELVFSETPNRELQEPECTAIAYSFTTNVSRARLPSLIQLQASGRMGIISDRMLARQLAELTQRHETLGTVIREAQGTDILLKHPKIFASKSTLVPVAGSPGELERDAETRCKLEEILANRSLLNDITYNADSYDAFMRDGFVPWVRQSGKVHDRVDALLGISHDEGVPQ
jgi:hypothetical protein